MCGSVDRLMRVDGYKIVCSLVDGHMLAER